MSNLRSLKVNLIANFVAQAYVMGIGIIMAPVYLSFMGAEAYGLIGFFTMLSAWFVLLDVGLTPTLVREAARYQGGAIDINVLRSFLRALEVIFGAVALLGAIALLSLSHTIATHWLIVKSLPISEVTNAVMLMGLAIPLRWVAGLYRGMIIGLERQTWLGGYNIVIATLRFLGVLLIFWTIGATPVKFFAYQFGVAIVELSGLVVVTYGFFGFGRGAESRFSWRPLVSNLGFSLTIAVATMAWVVIIQSDKLVLSKLLPLAEYGMASIAIIAANGVNAINLPFNQVLLPRLTKLVSQNNDSGVARFYSNATQAVCAVMIPVVTTLCFFAQPVVFAWTGNIDVARYAAPIVCLYAIGNGFVSLHSFIYYIQYAKGDLFLHFLGHALMVALLIPLFILGARHYGAEGTGAAWALINGIYAVCWMPLVHARLYKGLHWKWVTYDILPIAVPTVLAGWMLANVVPLPTNRWAVIPVIGVVGGALLIVAGLGSSLVRRNARRLLRQALSRFFKFQPLSIRTRQ